MNFVQSSLIILFFVGNPVSLYVYLKDPMPLIWALTHFLVVLVMFQPREPRVHPVPDQNFNILAF